MILRDQVFALCVNTPNRRLQQMNQSKAYYFTLKYDDLQRTNSEYLEDEKSRNWIPVGIGIYNGKIHHRNKMVEHVDIIF